jgi:hypothetical protein
MTQQDHIMYAALAIIGTIALVVLWWVTAAVPRRRALQEMGGEKERFMVGYLGGHPELRLASPLVMCTLSLTPQGLLIHASGQYARIRFEDLVEASEDEWQGPRWRRPEVPDARGQIEDRRVPVLRITFMSDDGFTESALFVCHRPEAAETARQVMQARAAWERAGA